jgi:GntR family transcriptional regulator
MRACIAAAAKLERIDTIDVIAGQRISTESELVEEFELARSTVRRAVGVLRESGLVHTVPQRGTYVSTK